MEQNSWKEKLIFGVIILYIIVFFIFCILGIVDCIFEMKRGSKEQEEIDLLKGKVYDLEEYTQTLREDVDLQKDVFSAYVNGKLVE